MKIFHFADKRSIHVFRRLKWLTDHGHECHLASLYYSPNDPKTQVTDKQYEDCGIKLYIFQWTPLTIIQLRTLIRKLKPDVLHSTHLTHYGFIGALTGFHPYVLTGWGNDVLIDPWKNPFFGSMIRYAVSNADAITYDGDNMIKPISQLLNGREVISRKILYGVDTDAFSPPISKMWKFPIIVSPRGFDSCYDPFSVITAFSDVNNRECRLWMPGTGLLLEASKKLARGLGIGERVYFLGTLSHRRMASLYKQSDIYVSASLSDGGIPVSMMEAMSSGLPIITYNTVGDYFSEDSGFSLEIKNIDQLSSAMNWLLSHDKERIKMGKINREIALKDFDFDTEMNKLVQLYDEVIV